MHHRAQPPGVIREATEIPLDVTVRRRDPAALRTTAARIGEILRTERHGRIRRVVILPIVRHEVLRLTEALHEGILRMGTHLTVRRAGIRHIETLRIVLRERIRPTAALPGAAARTVVAAPTVEEEVDRHEVVHTVAVVDIPATARQRIALRRTVRRRAAEVLTALAVHNSPKVIQVVARAADC